VNAGSPDAIKLEGTVPFVLSPELVEGSKHEWIDSLIEHFRSPFDRLRANGEMALRRLTLMVLPRSLDKAKRNPRLSTSARADIKSGIG